MEDVQGHAEPGFVNRQSTLWTIVVAVLILYAMPLIALAIDELVLGTYWILKRFPREAQEVFFYVYPFN